MSGSADSLKKRVCVTVFLDELFEEVIEEEKGDPNQVSEVIESEVKLAEKTYAEASQYEFDNPEKVNNPPNSDTKQSRVQFRPRKHRRELKFSKNHYDLFKNELDKYEYDSDIKGQQESRDPTVSTVSDSDFDLDDVFCKPDIQMAGGSISSVSEFGELDLSEGSFLSSDPVLSSVFKRRKAKTMTKLNSNFQLKRVLYSSKSTQFDGESKAMEEKAVEKIDEKVGNDFIIQENQSNVDNALQWKKTQKQIQLILEKAKSSFEGKRTYEGDQIRHYNLGSKFEEYEKTEVKSIFKDPFALFNGTYPNISKDPIPFDPVELSDSYMCVFPHIRRSPKVKKVWTNSKRIIWNDGFESDQSETECFGSPIEINVHSYENDSLHCYSLCFRCKETTSNRPVQDVITATKETQSDSTVGNSSFESLNSKTSQEANLVLKTLTKLADDFCIGSIFIKESEEEVKTKDKNVGTSPELEFPAGIEIKSKKGAEGDTFQGALRQDSELIFKLESKENLFLCDEILKHLGEIKAMPNEIILNRAEIILLTPKKDEMIVEPSCMVQGTNEILSEVFVKKKTDEEKADKNMTDIESEMVFAESEAYCDSDDVEESNSSVPTESYMLPSERSKEDVCVLEFQDKLSRSNVLRRMKTVEIVGDNSMMDMKNISTEVILICENISNSDVCMEAWQSSVSTLKSLTEMGQCYLKDSKDSSMYLIEIPLHFTSKKQKVSNSEQLFKI